MDHYPQPPPDAFTIAIFCALDVERTAILRTIRRLDEDENFRHYPQNELDQNSYTPGFLGDHLVVVIRLVQTGKFAAVHAASTLKDTFPQVKLCILVGVCGGAPKNLRHEDIVLGDVIISTRMINSDRGRMTDSGLERYDDHDNLPDKLRIPTKGLIHRWSSESDQRTIEKEINKLMEAHRQDFTKLVCSPEVDEAEMKRAKKYLYPGQAKDRLFEDDFDHRHRKPGVCIHCDNGEIKYCREKPCAETGCDTVSHKLISRPRLERGDRPQVQLHFGTFACADHVLRMAQQRDILTAQHDAIGFEMEAGGIWDLHATLVVKGVSDYADGHKNKDFQGYAATSSAKAVQVLLKDLPPAKRRHVDRVAPTMPGTPGFNVIPMAEIHCLHSHSFLNREKKLEKLLNIFCSRRSPALTGERALLTGAPGSGKTALYEKLYERAKDHYWAWWSINCQSLGHIDDDLENISSSLTTTANPLAGSGMPKLTPEELRRASIERIIGQKKPWFLILNDIDDGKFVEATLSKLLNCSRGSVLFVSRDTNTKLYFTIASDNIIHLDGLPETYGVSLFKATASKFDSAGSDGSCLELVRKLDYLPEAIRLAALFLCENPMEAASSNLSDQMGGFLRMFDVPEEKSTMTIFHDLFAKFTDKLRAEDTSPLAQDALSLLHVLAFVSSDHIAYSTLETALKNWHAHAQQNRSSERSMPEVEHASWFLSPILIDRLWKSLRDAFGQSSDKSSPTEARKWPRISWLDSDESVDKKRNMLGKALMLLERYGLIEWSRNTDTIAVKRLIQQCSFESIANTQTADLYAVRSLIMLSHCIESRYDEQSKSSRRLLHRHLEAHRQKFPNLGKLFGLLDVASALVLCMRISLTYYEYGDIATAKRIQTLAVAKATPRINEANFAEVDLMLKARSQLAASLFDFDGWGEREQAATIRLEVKEQREQLWLNNREDPLYHRQLISSLADLADSYDYMPDKTGQAIIYRQQVIDEEEKLTGNKSEEMTECKQRLARSYFRDGQRHRALALRKEIYDGRMGREHLSRQGQEPPDERALSNLSDLADSLCSFGHWLEAMGMRQKVLEARKRKLDPQHYDIMVAKSNLSISHMKMRHYEEAIKLREEIFLQYEAVFSLKNGLTLRAYCQLAHAVGRSDSPDCGPMKAFAMYREATEIWKDLTAEGSPLTHTLDRIDTMTNMADALQRYMLKNPTRKLFPPMNHLPEGTSIADKAMKLRIEIHEMLSQQHGEDNVITLVAQNAIADCYVASGRLEEARELRDQVLTRWKESMISEATGSDMRYHMAIRSQARCYDLLAAFWAPTGPDFYQPIVSRDALEGDDGQSRASSWRLLVQQRYERSGSWRSSHSSDRMSGYGSEDMRRRTGYLEAACNTWRDLLRLQGGNNHDEDDDKNVNYEVLRTMRDLGDALRQYNDVMMEQEEQGTESPLIMEARELWTRAHNVLAKPERLGPEHPEVLALVERIESLEVLPPADVVRINDWVSQVVEEEQEVLAGVETDAMAVGDIEAVEPISNHQMGTNPATLDSQQ
ncbi:kinesin light chain [Fusarium heterosporum]|uniref:Kinesin light chain n=1 Tax=Fusarium heterosporum TaxID=42747 RepID=A0A8H5TM20_FUSHE|nr:kinesin light chain [Fusarium heterosporum]